VAEDALILLPDCGQVPAFQEMIQGFYTDDKITKIIVPAAQPRKIFEQIFRNCKLIKAAGGLVTNPKNENLLIKRHGLWDLPKGKVEKKEKIPEAALREVQEECGISGLQITKRLKPTYHVYCEKNRWILKKTCWFSMFTTDTGVPKPQLREHITEAVWCSRQKVKQCMTHTYGNIRDVVESTLEF